MICSARKKSPKCNKFTARNFTSALGLDLLFTLAAFPLVSAAVSGRSLDVANRKLEVIRDELRRRDVPLYENRKRAAFVGFVKNLPRMALDGGTGAS